MKGTRKFKMKGVDYEELASVKFRNSESDKTYRVHFVEPVEQEDLDRLGSLLLEAEIRNSGDTEIIGGFIEYKIDDAPPAFQGMIAAYRRHIIRKMNEPSLETMLEDLEKAGVVTRLPDHRYRVEPRDERKWKLFDKNSDEEVPWGETLRDRDDEEYELVGGTPPHKPASAGFVRVVDDDGEKRELFPHVFDLEWRQS